MFHVKRFGTIGGTGKWLQLVGLGWRSADRHKTLGEAPRIGGIMRRAVA
jgi:hypothetical protein